MSSLFGWRIIDNLTFTNTKLPQVQPLKEKFFNNDIFEFDEETNTVSLVSSPIRSQILSGVLVTEKTYGKYKDKFLYRCMPHDRHIPEFLVPYSIKTGFRKIMFQFIFVLNTNIGMKNILEVKLFEQLVL